jgi:hypothetical protein
VNEEEIKRRGKGGNSGNKIDIKMKQRKELAKEEETRIR